MQKTEAKSKIRFVTIRTITQSFQECHLTISILYANQIESEIRIFGIYHHDQF